MQRACMATSLAGNAVDVLTITAPEGCGKPLSQRQGVVLSGKHCCAACYCSDSMLMLHGVRRNCAF